MPLRGLPLQVQKKQRELIGSSLCQAVLSLHNQLRTAVEELQRTEESIASSFRLGFILSKQASSLEMVVAGAGAHDESLVDIAERKSVPQCAL